MGSCVFVKSTGKGDLHAEAGRVVSVDAHHSRGAGARGAGSLSLGGSGASPISLRGFEKEQMGKFSSSSYCFLRMHTVLFI